MKKKLLLIVCLSAISLTNAQTKVLFLGNSFTYTYDSWINYNRNRLNLFELAKHYNKSILQWFKSYEFQKQILEDNNFLTTDATIYKSLQKSEIINPKIESEFGYLVDADKYNL